MILRKPSECVIESLPLVVFFYIDGIDTLLLNIIIKPRVWLLHNKTVSTSSQERKIFYSVDWKVSQSEITKSLPVD